MKNRWTRILALMLGLTMTFSVTACGGEDTSNMKESKEQGQTQSEDGKAEESQTAEEHDTAEPITLTVGTRWCDLGNGVHTDENLVLQTIKDKFNVEFEFVVYDQESLSLMAAGGDLPDIMITYDFTAGFTKSLIESGQLLALDDLLEDYGKNISANIPEALDNVRKYAEDRKVYVMPTNVAWTNKEAPVYRTNMYGLNFRYDIYKAVGSPEMNDWDDFLEVLKQMVDYERERTGEDDIYAFSPWVDWGTWYYIVGFPFSNGYTNDAGNHSFNFRECTFEANYTDENSVFWQSMKFYNKAWNMGIFDPDGFTQKAEQSLAKVQNGKVLANVESRQTDIEVCGEESCMVVAPVKGRSIYGVYTTENLFGYELSDARAITSNCEYPERAMQVLNWMDSQDGVRMINGGEQGVNWDYVDGVPQFIGELKDAYVNGGDISSIRKFSTGDVFKGYLFTSGVVANGDGYPNALTETKEYYKDCATGAFKLFAEDYGCTYPGEVYAKWVNEGLVDTEIDAVEGLKNIKSYRGLDDESWAAIASEADNYFMANVSSVIMAATDEEFEEAKAAMIDKFIEIGCGEVAEGYAKLEEEAKAAYAEANK